MKGRKKVRKRKKKGGLDTLSIMKSIRKPLPPAGRVHNPKNDYNRRDKSWMNEIYEDEED